MKYKGRERSTNVEDRRGGRGGMGPGKKVGGGIGIGVVVIAVVVMLLGGDPTGLLDSAATGGASRDYSTQTTATGEDAELTEFVSVVLKDTENAWNKYFSEQILEGQYHEPILVLFDDQVSSACGYASSATGPFYCPADEKLYIDLSFYDELNTRFRAPGDFAMAYVVAHEVGHHVQNLLGTLQQVQQMKRGRSKAEQNDLQVRVELQADFYAGMWAHYTQDLANVIEEGDIEEALNAAEAIGDDRLQRQARGYVVPESFTHGTSEQRARWFRKGYKSGRMSDGDTFGARSL